MTGSEAAGVQACIDVLGKSDALVTLMGDTKPSGKPSMKGVEMVIAHLRKLGLAPPKRRLVEAHIGNVECKTNPEADSVPGNSNGFPAVGRGL